MELSTTSLSDIYELTAINSAVTVLYTSHADYTESDAVILSVTASTSDSGVALSIDELQARLIGTGYEESFSSEIGYAKPQVDTLTKPEYVEVSSWGNVPDPDETDDIWFLYKFKAPDETTKTYTYTVSGTYTITTPDPDGVNEDEVEEDVPFSLTFTQEVSYDLDSNVTQFKRYI